jgi:hypothetical protein
MSHHHAGVVIENGTEDGLDGSIGGADLWAVHEVTDPEIIYIVHLIRFSHICAGFDPQPPLLFDQSKKGVVVNRGFTQKPLIPEVFVELLYCPVGIGLAFDLDSLKGVLIKPSWSATVCAALGFEGFKTIFTVHPEPGLYSGDTDFPQTIAGKVVLALGLFSEVLILGPCGFSQYGADDFVTFQGDFFSDVFFHGRFLLVFGL